MILEYCTYSYETSKLVITQFLHASRGNSATCALLTRSLTVAVVRELKYTANGQGWLSIFAGSFMVLHFVSVFEFIQNW